MKYLFLLMFYMGFLSASLESSESKTDLADKDCLPEYKFDGKKLVLTEKEWQATILPNNSTY